MADARTTILERLTRLVAILGPDDGMAGAPLRRALHRVS